MEPKNLINASPSLHILFDDLTKQVRNLGDIREKICSGHCLCFYFDSKPSTKFVEVELLTTRNCLSILAKTGIHVPDDEFAHRIPESLKWGKHYKKFIVIENAQMAEAMRYIKLAYKFVS